jgi:hypothetical protein
MQGKKIDPPTQETLESASGVEAEPEAADKQAVLS